MKPEDIVIRLDACTDLGMGHLARCLNLAKAFGIEGVHCHFALKYVDDKAIQRIEESGFQAYIIPQDVTKEEEIEFLERTLTTTNAQALILDVNYPNALDAACPYPDIMETLRQRVFIMVVDNLNPGVRYPAHVTVMPYILSDYEGPLNDDCTLLQGPSYFVFRDEFIDVAGQFEVRDKVETVLVSMGGANPAGGIQVALQCLVDLSLPLHVRLVVGPLANESDEELHAITQDSQIHLDIIRNCENMATEMLGADLLFTNSGMTKYEGALVGIPMIALSIEAFHHNIMELFVEKAGCMTYCGYIRGQRNDYICDQLRELIKNFGLRKTYYSNARLLYRDFKRNSVVSSFLNAFKLSQNGI